MAFPTITVTPGAGQTVNTLPNAGQQNSANSLPVVVASDQSTMPVSQVAAATGGATPYHLISASGTNATIVKGSAGTVYSIQIFNFSTTQLGFLKLFNKATAPVPGTDTPIKVIAVPQAISPTQPSYVVLSNESMGVAFSAGISFALTGGLADNDATAIAAGAMLINFDYF